MTHDPILVFQRIVDAVAQERTRQDDLWGVQRHPDGTGSKLQEKLAVELRNRCDEASKQGTLTWAHILDEEVAEALACKTQEDLVLELVQVAAVAAAWLDCIVRQGGPEGETTQAAEDRGGGSVLRFKRSSSDSPLSSPPDSPDSA